MSTVFPTRKPFQKVPDPERARVRKWLEAWTFCSARNAERCAMALNEDNLVMARAYARKYHRATEKAKEAFDRFNLLLAEVR